MQQGAGGLGSARRRSARPGIPHYFLGADHQGRDVMARLLYGGRNSLLIGITSALICCLLATDDRDRRGVLRRAHRRRPLAPVDVSGRSPSTCSRSASRRCSSLERPLARPDDVQAESLWLPTLIIALVYIPYVARPIRGQVLSAREGVRRGRDRQGASDWRLICTRSCRTCSRS